MNFYVVEFYNKLSWHGSRYHTLQGMSPVQAKFAAPESNQKLAAASYQYGLDNAFGFALGDRINPQQ